MCACGQASRSALSAGKVRIKSPIAPPRITKIRFINLLEPQPSGPCAHVETGNCAFIDWPQADGYTKGRSILREREGENHAAVNERKSMQTAPAKNCSRAPVDLIAQHVRDCDPK